MILWFLLFIFSPLLKAPSMKTAAWDWNPEECEHHLPPRFFLSTWNCLSKLKPQFRCASFRGESLPVPFEQLLCLILTLRTPLESHLNGKLCGGGEIACSDHSHPFPAFFPMGKLACDQEGCTMEFLDLVGCLVLEFRKERAYSFMSLLWTSIASVYSSQCRLKTAYNTILSTFILSSQLPCYVD